MKNIPLGLELTALGMGVVFASLIALTLIMRLLKLLSPGQQQSSATNLNASTTPAHQMPVAEISSELVAVMTAAISAHTGMPAGSFAIQSVRPAGSFAGSAWALAGRVRQLHLAETLFMRGTSK